MKIKIKFFCFGLFICAAFLGIKAHSAPYDYDLFINQSDIRFSKDILISGDNVRIYAKVRNVGSEDISGYVSFFRGSQLIGNSLAVSVLPSTSDDVFIDYVIPDDSFNIQAKIQGTDPADQNSANDTTQTALIYPDKDTDADGIVDRLDDDDDNDGLSDDIEKAKGTDPLKKDTDGDGLDDKADIFPTNAHEWQDTDGDGIGNNSDTDDDNDGLSDSQEKSSGTDPLRQDTDGDGVIDSKDYYPLDSKKSVKDEERNIFQPSANNEDAGENQTAQDLGDIKNLIDLQNELNNLTEGDAAAEQLLRQPLAQFDDIVKKVSSNAMSGFFRVNNFVLWLIIAFLLVLMTIIYLLQKNKASLRKNISEPIAREKKTSNNLHNSVNKQTAFKHQNIIDLKNFKKK